MAPADLQTETGLTFESFLHLCDMKDDYDGETAYFMTHKNPPPTGGGNLRVFSDKDKAISAITHYTKRVKEELGWEVKEVESEAGLTVTGDFKLGEKYIASFCTRTMSTKDTRTSKSFLRHSRGFRRQVVLALRAIVKVNLVI